MYYLDSFHRKHLDSFNIIGYLLYLKPILSFSHFNSKYPITLSLDYQKNANILRYWIYYTQQYSEIKGL